MAFETAVFFCARREGWEHGAREGQKQGMLAIYVAYMKMFMLFFYPRLAVLAHFQSCCTPTILVKALSLFSLLSPSLPLSVS